MRREGAGITPAMAAEIRVVATMEDGLAYEYRMLSAYLKVAGIRSPLRALSVITPHTAGVKPEKAERRAAPAPARVGVTGAERRAGSEVATLANPIQIMIQTVTCTLLTNWFSPSVLRTW
eukprot:scaffold21569_cov107-Isochrysis_galbana.AAC.2